MFDTVLQYLSNALKEVVNLLPDSPFHLLDNSPVAQYLPYINYFIPLDFVVTTMTLWLAAVGCFYLYQAILRWVRAIN